MNVYNIHAWEEIKFVDSYYSGIKEYTRHITLEIRSTQRHANWLGTKATTIRKVKQENRNQKEQEKKRKEGTD